MIQSRRSTLVVAGTGMAGAKLVEEVLARAPDRFHIRMFGAEPHGTYNRILLSSVLGGFVEPKQLWLNPPEWYEQHDVFVHRGVKAEAIDRTQQLIRALAASTILLMLWASTITIVAFSDRAFVSVFRTT